MKRTIRSITATVLIGGFSLFGMVSKAGADIKIPETQPKIVQVLTMRITAYASTPDETDNTPFMTANGTRTHDGIVASNGLAFGTTIQIPALFGTKIFTVEDRMNRRIQNTIDIWMSSKLAAINFGVARASVVVLSDTTSPEITEATTKGKF